MSLDDFGRRELAAQKAVDSLVDPWLTLNPIPRSTWRRFKGLQYMTDKDFLRRVIAYRGTPKNMRGVAQWRLDGLERAEQKQKEEIK